MPFVIEHPTMSRRHAEFHLGEDSVVLVDLGSANGTRVNEEALAGPRTLHDGDWVEFGRVLTRFRTQAPTLLDPAPTASAADVPQPQPSLPGLPDDRVLDALLDLRNESSVRAALAEAVSLLTQTWPDLRAVLAFDRISCEVLAAHPTADCLDAASLQVSNASIEVATRLGQPDLTALPAVQPALAWAMAVDLGVVVGKPLALHLDASARPEPAALEALGLATRALRAVLRQFDRARVASISDEDLKLAQRIQRRLLRSQPPPVLGYKIAVSYTPALAVGGDFYDLQITPNGELAVVIGDVSGKGVSASLYMAQIMAALRQFIPLVKGPGELLVTMNTWLQDVLEPGLFATMAACFLDPRKNSCRLAQAGHAPPVLRSANRKVIEMSSEPGMPLGAMSELKPKEQRLVLAEGDLLLFTTDGVEEGENDAGEAFGNDRRDAALKGAQGAFAATLAVREALLGFVGGPVSTDDMTIIAVQRED